LCLRGKRPQRRPDERRGGAGIAVIQAEALLAADVVTQNIYDALNLLHHPLWLAATLRL